MTVLHSPPPPVQVVYDGVVDDICTGRLAPDTRLRQEDLTKRFAVSRSAVQQAMMLLRAHGMLREADHRGVKVAAVDAQVVEHLYGLRAVIDGFAARSAAGRLDPEAAARGRALLAAGDRARRDRNYSAMVAADVDFHQFVVEQAANPLLAGVADTAWRNVHRIMGEVLFHGDAPAWVWDDHASIFALLESGDRDGAERLAKGHTQRAQTLILDALDARSVR